MFVNSRERKGERNMDVGEKHWLVASLIHCERHVTLNLLVYRTTLQPTAPPSQGLYLMCLPHIILQKYCNRFVRCCTPWITLKRRRSCTIAGVAQGIECQSTQSQDCQSGHMPGLQAMSPVGGALELAIHWCFSSSFSFPLSLKINNFFKRGVAKIEITLF